MCSISGAQGKSCTELSEIGNGRGEVHYFSSCGKYINKENWLVEIPRGKHEAHRECIKII